MDIIYSDEQIVVCIKPARILSTDEPGGLPSLLREAFQQPEGDFRTVHRLDRVVSGLMVVARSAPAAKELSRQIRENEFQKEYLAVVHGSLPTEGVMEDLLARDSVERKTYVVKEPGKGVQAARLEYKTLSRYEEYSLVRIHLQTGRTHQIRVQFSSRGFPLVGDRKYSQFQDETEIGLWSYSLAFSHPATGEPMKFALKPPDCPPWDDFK